MKSTSGIFLTFISYLAALATILFLVAALPHQRGKRFLVAPAVEFGN